MAKPKRDRIEYSKKYYIDNKDRISNRMKEYYIANKEEIKEQVKQYKLKNKDKLKESSKQYYIDNIEHFQEYQKKNKDRINKYVSNRRKDDVGYRLRRSLSSRIYNVLKGVNDSKSTIKLLGCSIKDFKVWIEKQFTEDMSWDNYGIDGWELDHVYPLSRFNLEQPYEQKIAFNWFNMQPMWASENRIKHDKLYI